MRLDLRRFALLVAVSTAVVALGTACGSSDSPDSVAGATREPASPRARRSPRADRDASSWQT